ncbi:MAG: phage tail protein [Gammaproteobacteria bacterium]|nr:phage tail protein [Gammaproteobacteria bacterium]
MSREVLSRLAERVETQFSGKYRGIVVDNADPERLGRLKLRIPSVLGESDEGVTDWAWPCVPFGGSPETGFFFIPETGAQVWVEFEEGNPDLPIWVGTVWAKPGGTSAVPEEARQMEEDRPQRRVLKTASGHVLEFCDVEGEESITLRHKDGATVTLDADGSVVIANKEGSHVYLNAADQEATVVDQHGNNLRLGEAGVTVTNSDGSLVDLAGTAVQVVAKNVHIRSETVSLGEGAMEPAILGTTFAAIFDAHVHPTAMGPSGPPVPAPSPLSAPTSPALSKAVKVK